MKDEKIEIVTPIEAEKILGHKYFYRQRVYRLAEKEKLNQYSFQGKACFSIGDILRVFLKDLEIRLADKFPGLDLEKVKIFYDATGLKRVVVDGIAGEGVSVDAEFETEEDLLNKVDSVIGSQNSKFKDSPQVQEGKEEAKKLEEILPEEILWIKVDTGVIQNVEVKSFILISLPSLAQFLGIRNDQFIEWIRNTTFVDFVLSSHYKHIQGTEIPVPWKRGVISGYTSMVPFELVPEIIVAFRQSGRKLEYPKKAEMLYNLVKATLESVGLAMSGNKSKAAEELARVGLGLGLNAADQIIAIFKQYESRDYQVRTTKEFNSIVKREGRDYSVVTGILTLGITGKYVTQWKQIGKQNKLPSKIVKSSREIMREMSPSNSVGMTFGERHYIKDNNQEEAIRTGIQGKNFYERLKKVGLLDDTD